MTRPRVKHITDVKLVLSTDLSNIPNASSANEEPENLEVKPLTPREPYSSEADIPRDSQSETSLEPRPSTFTFPSEDEPVTMISKSIPPSVISSSMRSSGIRKSGEGNNSFILSTFIFTGL